MLGLDLQDTAAAALAIDGAGRVLARAEHPHRGDVAGAALAALEAVTRSVATPLSAAGIASALPELPAHAAAAAAIGKRYPGPFLKDGIMAAGTAAAVAEAWVGAAAGALDVVYFAAGDHMVAGLIARGQPWLGAHGRAGAAAWLALNPVEREDYRKHGCLEAEVAAGGIVRRLVWRVKAGDRSRVQDAANGDLASITVDMVLDAARAGDGVSISVMRDTAKYLGMAAANLVTTADPEVLVLGGIMASAADLLFEPVRTELARRLSPATNAGLRIVPAALGSDAAAIGAARQATAALQ